MTQPQPHQKQEMFNHLVFNGADFFKRSIAELNESPKYSVINFFAAVELFFKARLLLEDWKDIFSNSQKADWNKLISGDIHSVNLDKAIEKLSQNHNIIIKTEEAEAFDKIRKHRNRLVHLFHPNHILKPDIFMLGSIVAEQCQAWYYLNKLLTDRWKLQFSDHLKLINELSMLMHQQRAFLQAKYNSLIPTMDELRQSGITIGKCPACEYLSAKETAILPPLVNSECLVCETKTEQLRITCPKCDAIMYVQELGEGVCDSCNNWTFAKSGRGCQEW